jgi:hypothetical protein
MNRRNFISGMTLAALGSNVTYSFDGSKSNKRLITLFLDGGIAHQPFLNAHPEAIGKYAPVNGSIKTNISGLYFGSDFTNLSKIANDLIVVHSFGHIDANHDSAKHYVNTHKRTSTPAANSPSDHPSYGSAVAKTYGESQKNGMPTYVKLSKMTHNSGAWLGSRYNGYDYDSSSELTLKVPKNRFKNRLKMLDIIDKDFDGNLARSWRDLREQATDIVSGSIGEAFNIESEPKQKLLDYQINPSDNNSLGYQLLLAKRLIKNGAKTVTARSTGWDNHSGVSDSFKTRGQELDKMLHIFISDLKSEGLLEDVLFVVMSEFGRTALNSNAPVGQDHWARLGSLMMVGGGSDGKVIGKFDKRILEPEDNHIKPEDLGYTILNHMDVTRSPVIDTQNRPRLLVDEGRDLLVM